MGREDYQQERYHCEYLVIGSGAGGGLSGYMLSKAGKDVIIMEEGSYQPRSTFAGEVASMTSRLYRNGGVFPFLGTPSIGFAEGRCVGGTTVINGALFWRTPEWILQEWQEQHNLTELTPNNLAPYFSTIEQDLHVTRHELEEDNNLDSLRIWQGAQALDWKVVMAPRAVKDCINENWCPTGCLAGGKQSVLETYIPRAVSRGARIFSDLKAEKIRYDKQKAYAVKARINGTKKPVEVTFDHLVLAAGAIQTPHLLNKSRLSKNAGKELQFHINLKLAALHREALHAEKGTIFTTQVQEFEKEGLLIMGSNLKPHYVAMTLSHFDNETIDEVLAEYDRCGIYVGMIRPESKGRIHSGTGKAPLVRYRFHPNDLPKIRRAIQKTCQVLFASDAEMIYLPVSGSQPVRNLKEVNTLLKKATAQDTQMISVHAMSSCPMGVTPNTSVVDPKGRLWDKENILITDASILPSNIGESPQGTIMGLAAKIITEHLQENP